jgi:hypothetical protein
MPLTRLAAPSLLRSYGGLATLSPLRGAREKHQLAANFISLMASKSCTPPPTRFVV